MSEFINREVLIRALETAEDQVNKIPNYAWKIIKELSTADVQENKTGEWKIAYLDHESFGVRPKVLYCSKCCFISTHDYRYCPNCGNPKWKK